MNISRLRRLEEDLRYEAVDVMIAALKKEGFHFSDEEYYYIREQLAQVLVGKLRT